MTPRALVLLLILACSCVTESPDELVLVASVEVVGSLDTNSCGSVAVALPDPWVRRVDLLRSEQGQPFWREAGGPLVSGAMSGREWRFRASSTTAVLAPDPATGHPGCVLRLDDDLRFTLTEMSDGGAGDAGTASPFEGQQGTTVSTQAGSDCTAVLNTNGGNFLALPCAFHYDLSGRAR